MEWTAVQQDLINRIGQVAVFRRVLNRCDAFRGILECENSGLWSIERVDDPRHAEPANVSEVPADIQGIFNTLGASQLRKWITHGRGIVYYLGCRKNGRTFFLQFERQPGV
jgi:hypothetical protein